MPAEGRLAADSALLNPSRTAATAATLLVALSVVVVNATIASSFVASVKTELDQRFARDLGVFQQNVNRYESGTTPHTDFLITLAMQENISLDWLLLGRGQPHPG